MSSSARLLRTVLLSAALTALLTMAASAATLGAGTVTADALRLRSVPDEAGDILATASGGVSVVVLEDSGDGWYKVNYNTVEGYMSADYLDVSTTAETDLGYGQVTAGGSSLALRGWAGTQYDKVASIPEGTVLALEGVCDGWYKVTYAGKSGYVSSDYITITTEPTVSAASSLGAEIDQDVHSCPSFTRNSIAGLSLENPHRKLKNTLRKRESFQKSRPARAAQGGPPPRSGVGSEGEALQGPGAAGGEEGDGDLPGGAVQAGTQALHLGLLQGPEGVEVLPAAPQGLEPGEFLRGKGLFGQEGAPGPDLLHVGPHGGIPQGAEGIGPAVAQIEVALRPLREPGLAPVPPVQPGQVLPPPGQPDGLPEKGVGPHGIG